MNITVITVGKIKEKYLVDGIKYFEDKIKKRHGIDFIEVSDEKCPENLSQTEMEIVKDKEGKKIIDKIPSQAFICTLEIEGKLVTTKQFITKIEDVVDRGYRDIVFIIGGSLGISDEIKALSNFKLSFSPMTFPHQLMKLILLEQIANTIQN